ncbi:threonine-phosphate decarboxylase [Arenicella chitinivorans]|uniref:Threonine-phosphate decarboxylase n=1 Tax=Arenicella chitinivorans TaxID=1329800 RepID=A0A918RKA4_9GAMM|nr:threonine-phosphate decarboxylase [Arenicella chitinivorans]GHA02441.1 threonine-phosphate decarboxylase [Arenicella chitinivorans]
MTIASNNNALMRAPKHGGDVGRAILQYGGSAQDWLDLSTGISPWSYPLPNIDDALWHQLPTEPTSLSLAAADYYGCTRAHVVATPGSQLAIRLLPTLLHAQSHVAIPQVGYQEHRYGWQRAGHHIHFYKDSTELNTLVATQQVEHAVVINPNNPTTERYTAEELRALGDTLRGLLLVDEAFADTETSSMVGQLDAMPNLLILRSPGKFFGLAGARIGFLLSRHRIADALKTLLMPWSLSAPACYVVESALRDKAWQVAQQRRIRQSRDHQERHLSQFLASRSPTLELRVESLYCCLLGAAQPLYELHRALAQQKIWTRINTPQEPAPWLRLGLAGPARARLKSALDNVLNQQLD